MSGINKNDHVIAIFLSIVLFIGLLVLLFTLGVFYFIDFSGLVVLIILITSLFYIIRFFDNVSFDMSEPEYLIIPGEGIKTFTNEVIKFKDIKSLEISSKSMFRVGTPAFSFDLKYTLPGYHVGTYYISGLGKVKMISTTWLGTLVIITTDKIKYALSPKNPEHFVKKVNSYLRKEINKNDNTQI